jgi:hypothetical protein
VTWWRVHRALRGLLQFGFISQQTALSSDFTSRVHFGRTGFCWVSCQGLLEVGDKGGDKGGHKGDGGKPDCKGKGCVCSDPKIVGGDGVVFCHGRKNQDFYRGLLPRLRQRPAHQRALHRQAPRRPHARLHVGASAGLRVRPPHPDHCRPEGGAVGQERRPASGGVQLARALLARKCSTRLPRRLGIGCWDGVRCRPITLVSKRERLILSLSSLKCLLHPALAPRRISSSRCWRENVKGRTEFNATKQFSVVPSAAAL